MLILPPTLRRPKESEVPKFAETFEKLKEAETAVIEQGFVVRPNTGRDLSYNFFAVINVDNPYLWEVFSSLCNELPEEAGCIYGVFDEDNDLIYSPYLPRTIALEILGRYKKEITGDCDLQVSLVNNNDDRMVQVSISEVKYISFWGQDEVSFRSIMKELGIMEIPGMRFMDEFPTAVTPLTKVDKDARSTKKVVAGIFAALKEEAERIGNLEN